jgi:hypothetical protein
MCRGLCGEIVGCGMVRSRPFVFVAAASSGSLAFLTIGFHSEGCAAGHALLILFEARLLARLMSASNGMTTGVVLDGDNSGTAF